MSPHGSLALQYLIVAIAVAISAWVVLRGLAPNAARRLRIVLALPLVREGRPRWLRAIGKRLAPVSVPVDGACGACRGCGTDEP